MYVYQFQTRVGGGLPKSDPLFSKPLHATREESGARFGAAVSNIGDIDGDGREDFAVAAPGEEQMGAVYIYRGHQNWMLKGTHYHCSFFIFPLMADCNFRGITPEALTKGYWAPTLERLWNEHL